MNTSNFPGQTKALLFDLDGTIMDTDNQSVAKFTKLFSWLHFPKPGQLARKLVMAAETPVNGMITFIDLLGLDKPFMDLWLRISHRKGKIRHRFKIMPGVMEMVSKLKSQYKLGVVTTRSLPEAEAFLEENNLYSCFDVVVSRSSTRRLKPHPEPLLFAAQQLGVPVSGCVMVGDTTPDIKSARAAGARSIGVLCGFGTREELEKAGADLIIEHTSEVGSLFDGSE